MISNLVHLHLYRNNKPSIWAVLMDSRCGAIPHRYNFDPSEGHEAQINSEYIEVSVVIDKALEDGSLSRYCPHPSPFFYPHHSLHLHL